MIDQIADILGKIGRVFVLLGMGSVCILIWYLIITQIIIK